MTKNKDMNQKLRVWWNPQLGASNTMLIPVTSVEEGKKILDLLAAYDCFLMNNHIRGDYCNTGGLEMWDEKSQEWNDWECETDDNYYSNVDEYCEEVSPQSELLKDFSEVLFSQVRFE